MKEVSYARQRRRGIKRKLKLVELKGGCCEICSYDKNLAVLTFHHSDPKTKLFNDSVMLLYDQALLAEGSKIDNPAAFVTSMNKIIEEQL